MGTRVLPPGLPEPRRTGANPRSRPRSRRRVWGLAPRLPRDFPAPISAGSGSGAEPGAEPRAGSLRLPGSGLPSRRKEEREGAGGRRGCLEAALPCAGKEGRKEGSGPWQPPEQGRGASWQQGIFLGGFRAARRKPGLGGEVQEGRKQRAGVSPSPGGRRRLSGLTARCLFRRQNACVPGSLLPSSAQRIVSFLFEQTTSSSGGTCWLLGGARPPLRQPAGSSERRGAAGFRGEGQGAGTQPLRKQLGVPALAAGKSSAASPGPERGLCQAPFQHWPLSSRCSSFLGHRRARFEAARPRRRLCRKRLGYFIRARHVPARWPLWRITVLP